MQDKLTIAMKDKIIQISQERLGYALPDYLIDKVRSNKWSYMGLELMIDTVSSIEPENIEKYLNNLY